MDYGGLLPLVSLLQSSDVEVQEQALATIGKVVLSGNQNSTWLRSSTCNCVSELKSRCGVCVCVLFLMKRGPRATGMNLYNAAALPSL